MERRKSKIISSHKQWTDEDIELFTELYPHNYNAVIMGIFECTYSQVTGKAERLGLKKTQEFRDMYRRDAGDLLRKVGQNTRILPGTTPPNKGKKMPDDLKEKIKHTWFKPGNTPHNTKEDGYERISKDGYIEIRIAPAKFVLKHRYIYESHHGPIPPRHCVTFIDGNKYNLDINNLKLVSREEHAVNNRGHQYPEEIKQTIKLLNKLNKKICQKIKS